MKYILLELISYIGIVNSFLKCHPVITATRATLRPWAIKIVQPMLVTKYDFCFAFNAPVGNRLVRLYLNENHIYPHADENFVNAWQFPLISHALGPAGSVPELLWSQDV